CPTENDVFSAGTDSIKPGVIIYVWTSLQQSVVLFGSPALDPQAARKYTSRVTAFEYTVFECVENLHNPSLCLLFATPSVLVRHDQLRYVETGTHSPDQRLLRRI